MALNEVIRTSGDVRRTLAQCMVDVRSGDLSVEKAMAVAALSKELTASIQAEVNAAKIKVSLGDAGKEMGRLTHMGKMLVGDESVPTLSGA